MENREKIGPLQNLNVPGAESEEPTPEHDALSPDQEAVREEPDWNMEPASVGAMVAGLISSAKEAVWAEGSTGHERKYNAEVWTAMAEKRAALARVAPELAAGLGLAVQILRRVLSSRGERKRKEKRDQKEREREARKEKRKKTPKDRDGK